VLVPVPGLVEEARLVVPAEPPAVVPAAVVPPAAEVGGVEGAETGDEEGEVGALGLGAEVPDVLDPPAEVGDPPAEVEDPPAEVLPPALELKQLLSELF